MAQEDEGPSVRQGYSVTENSRPLPLEFLTEDVKKIFRAKTPSGQREPSRQIAVGSRQWGNLNLENPGGGVDFLMLAVS